jgi:LmbE family N-acetylglucosaminyl deacetylase
MILVLAPHPDDEIHCAGLILNATEPVYVFSCTYGKMKLGAEQRESSRVLGFTCIYGETRKCTYGETYRIRHVQAHRQELLNVLWKLQKKHDPRCVICPSSTDLHQDHRTVYEEAMRAFRNAPLLLGWEHPSNQRESRVNYFVELTEADVDAKVEAWKCYKSQQHRTWFDEDLIRSLAIVRGRQCRSSTGLAEGYELLSCRV